MAAKVVRNKVCLNPKCDLHNIDKQGNIRHHTNYMTKQGKRKRYICKRCNVSFCSTKGTPKYRLRCSTNKIEKVCHLSAEGVDISKISRIENISWNTVNRYLEKGQEACREFNKKHLKNYELKEVQADEIKTYLHKKKCVTWIMTNMETTTRFLELPLAHQTTRVANFARVEKAKSSIKTASIKSNASRDFAADRSRLSASSSGQNPLFKIPLS